MPLLSEFKKGMLVRYVPARAKGDINHPACQNGVVADVGERHVLVKYDNERARMVYGNEPYPSQATKPEELIILSGI